MNTYTFSSGDRTFVIEAPNLTQALAEYRRQLKEVQ